MLIPARYYHLVGYILLMISKWSWLWEQRNLMSFSTLRTFSITLPACFKERDTFLDTTSIPKDGNIHTDLHCRPTDTRQYLRLSSCPPPHRKRNIPYYLVLRIQLIVSDDVTSRQSCAELRTHLISKRNTSRIINHDFAKLCHQNSYFYTIQTETK